MLQKQIDKFLAKCATRFDNSTVEQLTQVVEYAKQKHDGQKRHGGSPYFVHPLEVADALYDMGLDYCTIAAGLLHDVIEDCNTTEDEISKVFGAEIASLVQGVTKLAHLGNRKQNEALDKLVDAVAKAGTPVAAALAADNAADATSKSR